MTPDSHNWEESSLFVQKELERLNACFATLNVKMDQLLRDVIILKVKSGVYGLVGGLLPAIAALIYYLLKQ